MALGDWLLSYGYSDRELPRIAGTYTGKSLIVCGDGIGVWHDLELFGARHDHERGKVRKCGWDIMTINKLVEVMPANIEHIYSNQPRLLEKFVAARRCEYTREFETPRNSHSCMAGARHHWPFGGHGTSGLGATMVGVGLGYDQIVLCGVPLDDGPHNGEPPWRKTAFASAEAAGPKTENGTGEDGHWKRARLLAFEGKVKSMSGRTRDWLGAPE